jgi:SAM-dependent methyltransferase
VNPDEYTRMFELEDRYWWFVGRRRIALRLFDRFRPKGETLLDVGCGTGVVLKELESRGKPIGLDMSPLALGFCRRRGLIRLVRGDATKMPLLTDRCTGIIALDVFEHVEDDEAAFAEAFRALEPGGILVLSVPAFQFLWGPHDIALMHFRRYTRPGLRSKLHNAGFAVQRLSYSVFFPFPWWLSSGFSKSERKVQPKLPL